MQIIIDAYNYILRTMAVQKHDDKALQRAREQLLRLAGGYAQGRKVEVVVVFDGQLVPGVHPPKPPAGVRVLFSRAPQSADALIKTLIEKNKQPRAATVVTSDGALAHFIKTCGAQHLSVEAFRERLEQKKSQTGIAEKFDGSTSAKDVEEWLRLFNAPRHED